MNRGIGNIEKRDKEGYSWRLIVSDGYDQSGKKIRRTKTVHVEGKTLESRRKEARRELSLFSAEVENGSYQTPSKMTLAEFSDKWLSEVKTHLEVKTFHSYSRLVKGRICTAFGHMKLESIKPLHLLDFYKNLQEIGIREDQRYVATDEFIKSIRSSKLTIKQIAEICDVNVRTLNTIIDGKPTTFAPKICSAMHIKFSKMFEPSTPPKALSNNSVLYYHRILSVMFNDAVRWGLINENPCKRVQPPKVKHVEMGFLDEDGITRMIECLIEEPLRIQVLVMIALVTGCRRGEIAALQWSDIDLKKKTINIKKSAIYASNEGIIIKEPKTRSSIRKIAIPDTLVSILEQYQRWQKEERLKVSDLWLKDLQDECEMKGEKFIDPKWLFTTWDGHMFFPDSLSTVFKAFLKRHDLPNIRLHDLRHTSCTMLLQSGLNVRAVASRMGHANPNVTLAVYAHALKSADYQAAEMMENLLTQKRTKTGL